MWSLKAEVFSEWKYLRSSEGRNSYNEGWLENCSCLTHMGFWFMRFIFFYSWSINLSQSSELLFLQYKNNKPIYSCCNYLFLSFVWLQYNLKDKCHGLGVFWWRSYTYLKWPFPINSREARFFLCIHLNLNESSRCRSKMHAMLMRGTNHLQLVSKLKLYSYVVSPLINPKAADVCRVCQPRDLLWLTIRTWRRAGALAQWSKARQGVPEPLREGVAVTHIVLEQAWWGCIDKGDQSTKKWVSANSPLLGQFSNPELASQHIWVLVTPWSTLRFESLSNQT